MSDWPNIEPGMVGNIDTESLLLSIAISLKRIADVAELVTRKNGDGAADGFLMVNAEVRGVIINGY